jgi:hypothetical protein
MSGDYKGGFGSSSTGAVGGGGNGNGGSSSGGFGGSRSNFPRPITHGAADPPPQNAPRGFGSNFLINSFFLIY